MHNQIIGPTGMDPDSHLARDTHSTNDNTTGSNRGSSNNNNNDNSNNGSSHSYGTESWVGMSCTQTAMPDYGAGFAYMPPATHGLPSESLSRMPPPPPPQHNMLPHPIHPQLPMLLTPSQATWPSLLTHPNPSSYSAPPMTMAQLSAAGLVLPKPHKHSTNSAPRKTLTDDDRRRMCEYAEANPGVKQTDIGNMFGVERR